MGKSEADHIDFWTIDEYQEFISNIPAGSRYHAIFQVLFWTGMREGEMLALTKRDIDLKNNKININKTIYSKNGVDIVTDPKTKESIRKVDIPQFLADELEAYMNRLYGLRDGDRIFLLRARAVQKKLERDIEKYHLKPIHVHCLRHSCAAFLISKNVEPMVIKERLGHKDIRITMNTYGHLYPSRQKEIADLLDSHFQEMNQCNLKENSDD